MGDGMSEGRVFVDITMSLDGFIAGPNDGVDNPLGDGGERLHDWVYDLATWREPHGLAGGVSNTDSDILDEAFKATGAVVLGKRMYENAQGWGDSPPFHVPVFVLTHEERPQVVKNGGTTFTFVTGAIESAVEQAKTAAGDRSVSIGGGAHTIQQALDAGLLDELQVHIAPIMLGGGIRLFDQSTRPVELACTRVLQSPRVTHLKYDVVK
jgi:dihydrofolate reductase